MAQFFKTFQKAVRSTPSAEFHDFDMFRLHTNRETLYNNNISCVYFIFTFTEIVLR